MNLGHLSLLVVAIFSCAKAPTQGATSSMAGAGGSTVSSSSAGGKDWDGGGEGGWIEQADGGPDAGCPPVPNGGIGTCADPISDCPALTVEQAACWTWVCDCTPGLCYCVAVPVR